MDAVVRDEPSRIGEIGRDAGGRDGFSAVEAAGDFAIEDQELGEQIGFGRETISGENCGIERGERGVGGVGGFETLAHRNLLIRNQHVTGSSPVFGSISKWSPASRGWVSLLPHCRPASR